MGRKVGCHPPAKSKRTKGQKNVPGYIFRKLRSLGMLPSGIRSKIFAMQTNEVPHLNTIVALLQATKKSTQAAKLNAIYKVVKAEFLLNKAAKKKRGKAQIKDK